MSLNEHYEILPTIPGESARAFLDRYRANIGSQYPSMYELRTYYRDLTELSILDPWQVGEALQWCKANLDYECWYSFNTYFVFDDSSNAALFKITFCSEKT